MKRAPSAADIRFYAAWMVVLTLVFFAVVPQAHAFIIDRYEDMAFALNPSAAHAFSYGESHFDASNPAEYDINRAQYFFQKAAALDPKYPYLYHELARISFLRGQYQLALAQINFQISMHGNSEPNSYYVRGLIEGYMGDYTAAVNDYAHFLQFDPNDWAAMNDDAWVLLKAQRFQDAANITAKGLALESNNPWLLNSRATALYELHHYADALAAAQKAQSAVATLTGAQWSHAYPGNDPAIAGEGLASFRQAVADNVHSIQAALASSTVQFK